MIYKEKKQVRKNATTRLITVPRGLIGHIVTIKAEGECYWLLSKKELIYLHERGLEFTYKKQYAKQLNAHFHEALKRFFNNPDCFELVDLKIVANTLRAVRDNKELETILDKISALYDLDV
jgi:hypothetical protein